MIFASIRSEPCARTELACFCLHAVVPTRAHGAYPDASLAARRRPTALGRSTCRMGRTFALRAPEKFGNMLLAKDNLPSGHCDALDVARAHMKRLREAEADRMEFERAG